MNLEIAVDCLIDHGRANAAIVCLETMVSLKMGHFDCGQVVRALKAVLKSPDGLRDLDMHAVEELIKALQDDPNTNPDDLF